MPTEDIVADVRAALAPLADPGKAAGMAAYMKGRFAFLGVQTPARRRATRAAIRGFAGEPLAAAGRLWAAPEREFQYVACDLLGQHAPRLSGAALDGLLNLVSAKSWWDTVDALAHVIGGLVRRERSLVVRIDQLLAARDFWRRRVALLHQLGWGADTDRARLFGYCLRLAGEKEFFIRKAIGWALRDYAWHDPAAVQAFLARHGAELSPLSRRQAEKNLAKPGVAD